MSLIRTIAVAIVIAMTAASAAVAKPNEKALVAQAEARGQLIYDYDQAAWHSTDVMLEELPKARMAEIKGWLVEPDGEALRVLYYGYEGDKPYAVYVASVRNNRVVSSSTMAPDAKRDLSPPQARMALARKVAMTAPVSPCTRAAFNTVIVPPVSETAPVEVYLLSAQTVENQYPFGGHFLVTVGADGKVVSTRPFMKSCMNQSLPPNAVAAMVSHLLDPTPTEIHAWLARWMGKSVYVMVTDPQQLWEVTAKGIVKVSKP
jgi:hypothetical protein